MRNPREGGYAGASGPTAWRRGLTTRGGGTRETLKLCMPHLSGTPNGPGQATCSRWSRTHVSILQYILLTIFIIFD
jgi:hypothetical protein